MSSVSRADFEKVKKIISKIEWNYDKFLELKNDFVVDVIDNFGDESKLIFYFSKSIVEVIVHHDKRYASLTLIENGCTVKYCEIYDDEDNEE